LLNLELPFRAMQQASQITGPDYAPLVDDMFFAQRADLPIDRFIAPRLDVALAFILGKPLKVAPGGPSITLFDVLSATAQAGLATFMRRMAVVHPSERPGPAWCSLSATTRSAGSTRPACKIGRGWASPACCSPNWATNPATIEDGAGGGASLHRLDLCPSASTARRPL